MFVKCTEPLLRPEIEWKTHVFYLFRHMRVEPRSEFVFEIPAEI